MPESGEVERDLEVVEEGLSHRAEGTNLTRGDGCGPRHHVAEVVQRLDERFDAERLPAANVERVRGASVDQSSREVVVPDDDAAKGQAMLIGETVPLERLDPLVDGGDGSLRNLFKPADLMGLRLTLPGGGRWVGGSPRHACATSSFRLIGELRHG